MRTHRLSFGAYVGQRIQQRRKQLGLVQTDANNPHHKETVVDRVRKRFPRTAITDSTVQNIELGRSQLRLEDAIQLCVALEIPLESLVVDSGHPDAPSAFDPAKTNIEIHEELAMVMTSVACNGR